MKLIAVSPDNEIFIWDWDDLSQEPQTGSVRAQMAAAMGGDHLLWIPPGIDDVLVVGNLKGDKELSRLSLGVDKKCKMLQTSQNGKYAVALLSVEGPGNQIQLVTIVTEPTDIRSVETKTIQEGLKLNNVGISNDGTIIAAVGGNETGYLLVVGANDKQLLWEQYVEDCNELDNVLISPDGKTVYASEPGRSVYVFNVTTRKLVKRLEMDKYKTTAKKPQTISCIALNNDGRLLAVVSSPMPRVWIFNVQSGEKISTMKIGNFPISSITFSPDSSLFAQAIAANQPIRIWKFSKSP